MTFKLFLSVPFSVSFFFRCSLSSRPRIGALIGVARIKNRNPPYCDLCCSTSPRAIKKTQILTRTIHNNSKHEPRSRDPRVSTPDTLTRKVKPHAFGALGLDPSPDDDNAKRKEKHTKQPTNAEANDPRVILPAYLGRWG